MTLRTLPISSGDEDPRDVLIRTLVAALPPEEVRRLLGDDDADKRRKKEDDERRREERRQDAVERARRQRERDRLISDFVTGIAGVVEQKQFNTGSMGWRFVADGVDILMPDETVEKVHINVTITRKNTVQRRE